MLTKEQIEIFSIFRENISKKFTFKEIKEKSRKNSNNLIQLAIKTFKKLDIIKSDKIGNVIIYYLNLDNNLTISYLSLIEQIKINNEQRLPKDILNAIQKNILKKTEFFILLVFGSYAKGKVTEKSDLDVAVLTPNKALKKESVPYIETIKRRELLHIHYEVFTRDEFLEMLKVEQENVGKEIFRNNFIYYGAEQYYNLIKKVTIG
jgi:predicted nucleotidyltransferase